MRYEASLDGLRAVFVGGVVAVHVGVPLNGGGNGVEAFFALSGFLITRNLMLDEKRHGRFDLVTFYRNRVARLAPALLVTLALVSAYILITPARGLHRAWACVYALFYAMNFNRAFGWGPDDYLGHTWSLSMEEQFYFIWPMILLLTPTHLRIWATATLIGVVCLWRGFLLLDGASISRVYNGLDTHSEVLLMGCITALNTPGGMGRPSRGADAAVWVLLLIFAADYVWMPAATTWGQGLGMPAIGGLSCLLILLLPGTDAPRRFLSWPPLVYLGRISYGIYLYHYPILIIGREQGVRGMAVISPVASVLLAAMTFHLLERPVQRRFKRHPRPREVAA